MQPLSDGNPPCPVQPSVPPTMLPIAKVTPAAAPPNTSCRSPPNHHGREVIRVTTAPQANRATKEAVTVGHTTVAPTSSGRSGTSAPNANETKDEMAATMGEGKLPGRTPNSVSECTWSAVSGSE